jgi:hypothetical protein
MEATTAFWIDRAYDREYAGPPPSRFRNYLLSRRGDIVEAVLDYGDAGWCQEVWKTATSPVMHPGFVREAADLMQVSVGLTEADGGSWALGLVVDVATRAFPGPWPEGLRPGWERGPSWIEPPVRLVEAPLRRGRPSAAAIVRVRALLEPCPAPALDDHDELWQAAEATVERLVAQANGALSPVLAALEEQR